MELILPHGSRSLIAERAGIRSQHVVRSIKAGNRKTISAAKSVLTELVNDTEEIQRLSAKLETFKTLKPKRRKAVKVHKEWYTVAEAAQILNKSADTIIRRITGETPRYQWPTDAVRKEGRTWRIHRSIIENGGK